MSLPVQFFLLIFTFKLITLNQNSNNGDYCMVMEKLYFISDKSRLVPYIANKAIFKCKFNNIIKFIKPVLLLIIHRPKTHTFKLAFETQYF